MKTFSKIFFTLLLVGVLSFSILPVLSQSKVSAANAVTDPGTSKSGSTGGNKTSIICTVFPFIQNVGFLGVRNVCNIDNANSNQTGIVNSTKSFVQFGLSLVFIGLIAIAIFMIIKSAIKYIQSEGNQGKVEEAKKAIQAVFVGIVVLVVGIVGIFILLAFFNATGAGAGNSSTTSNDVNTFFNGTTN